MFTGLLASQGWMIFLAFKYSIICLYAGRILLGNVYIFGPAAVFPWMRLKWWLIWRNGRRSVIFLPEKTSGNWEMKLLVSEFVIAESLALFPFVQVR